MRSLRCELLESREMLTTYFVDATHGNDSWTGLAGAYSSGTTGPWKTIAKVNSMTQAAGDSVLFARGEVWRETLTPDSGSSAARITYGAYGDASLPKPLLLASTELDAAANWYNVGGNIWSSQPSTPTVTGSEKLTNPSFTSNANGWTTYVQGDASATGARDTTVYDSSPAGYSVNVTASGSDPTYIQFFTTSGMSITAGNYYLLTFRAKCTSPSATPIVPELQKLTSPWTYYGTICSTSVALTTGWATYTVLYQANTTATDAGLRFYLAGGNIPNGAKFSVDTLSFKQCTLPADSFDTDVGNIIFNNQSCGVKKWSQADLSQQGDFWYDASTHSVKVYSTSNPASFYSDIEVESQNTRSIEASNKSYITIQDFDVRYSDYAIWVSGDPDQGISAHDVTVRGCDVSFVGGGQWQGTVRGGNAIEITGNAYNVVVENNRVWDIYDAGVALEVYATWYGVAANQHDIIIRNNVVWNCEYSLCLSSDSSTANNIYFENNTCAYAGFGWSEGQRGSGENGNNAGYNMWVQERDSTVTNLYVRNNIFYESFTTGVLTAIYNSVGGFSDDIAGMASLHLDHNLYYESSGNVAFMQNYAGYTSAQFAQYQAHWAYDAHSCVALPGFAQLPASPYTITPSAGDFLLESGSPAIDSGTNTGSSADFSGNARPHGFGYDMGAYENMYDTSVATGLAVVATDASKAEGNTGTTLFYDDFEGSSLDTNKWAGTLSGSAMQSASDSLLTLAMTAGPGESTVTSTTAFGYNTFTFTIGTFTGPDVNVFGIVGQGGRQITMQNDGANGWRLYVNDGSSSYTSSVLATPTADDVYSIVWKSDSVEVRRNGTSILTETTVLPTGTMNVLLQRYWTGTSTYQSVAVGASPFIFTVNRTGATTGATTVNYTVTGSGTHMAGAADFGGTLPSGTVSFAAGETSKRVAIYVSGDLAVELDEGFTVTLSSMLFTDEFEGSSIDSAKWTTTLSGNATQTVTDSVLTLAMPSGPGESKVTSTTAFGYNTFTFTIGAAFTGPVADVFGLAGGGQQATIQGNPGSGNWYFYVNDGVNPAYTSTALAAPAAGDVYSIVWKSNSVELRKNGISILTETSSLPNGTMNVVLDKYWAGTATYQSVTVGPPTNNTYITTRTAAATIANDDTGQETGLAIATTDATKTEGDSTTLLYDTFGGSSVDSAAWTSTLTGSATQTVEDSLLALAMPSGPGESKVTSTTAFGCNTFSFTIGAAFTGPAADAFGLVGGDKQITIRNDVISGWCLYVNDGANPAYSSEALAAPAAGDVYTIVWKSGSVELQKNGATVLTETSVLPTGTMNVVLDKHWAGTATYESVVVGATPFTFTVTRTGSTTGETTVNYAVTGSGANQADAADFGGTLPSGTVSFAAGETSKPVTVYIAGDTTDEPDEGFTVMLSSPTGNAYILTQTTTGTILDDDATPPAVESVVVNDGSVQRSNVTSLTITFNQLVTLDNDAFEVFSKGADGGMVMLGVSSRTVNNKSVITLSFSGRLTDYGSLKDGDYRLTIDSDRVHSAATGATRGGEDYRFGNLASDAFFRLYGDSDGDRDVDNLDFARFRATMGKKPTDAAFLSYFSFDGDSDIDNLDFAWFRARVGTHRSFTA